MKALVALVLLVSACTSHRLPSVNAPADGAEYYQPNQPTYALQSRILPDPHGGLGHSQDPDIRVTDIRLTATYTVLYLTYGKSKDDRYFNYAGTSAISFNPKAVLASSDGKRTYALLKTEGIPTSPETVEIKQDAKLSFVLYFDRLDKGVEAFDLFECKSDNENSCFNVAGMTVRNPVE
ncbi:MULTISPECIES: hypothetical protein [Spirosoma]|uniref:Lipoprotein n=1 Tax=Spirosoma liriopis TaxID=2937440 RepID=A0ABT0HHE5_9BACT|nr:MULTISPECIES: hypothetical protein [Spirosoma]MCK8491287.1 hypothetical protein [Spirosoma liriopis]UHG90661.1 hypothetical protein LQ777_20735 [Spirosoma oryzicola]